MIKTIAFSLLMIFLNSGILFAQDISETGSYDFGVILGLNEYQIKELVLSNIRHRGFLASFGLSYGKADNSSISEFRFNFIFNILQSRYEEEDESYAANPSINYRYMKKITEFSDNISLFLGGISGWNLHMNFYEDWDESHIYWLNSYFLGIAERLSYQTSNKSTINLDINIPIVVLISRPPKRFLYKELNSKFSWFFKRFHDDLTLTSVHQHFEVNMILEYKYEHSNILINSFFWSFSYLNNSMSYSKSISILTHTFGVTIIF